MGASRRSPEGDRKALWNFGKVQFGRKINLGCPKKSNTLLIVAGAFASAEATRGLSDRPLDPFGRHYRSRLFPQQNQRF